MSPEDLRQVHAELRDRLVDAGLLISTGVDGLYGRNAVFESVVRAVDEQACLLGADENPEVVDYPPFLTREAFDRIGYVQTFPQLAGTVFSFSGGEREHATLMQTIADGESYSSALSQTELALTPACCYPTIRRQPAGFGTKAGCSSSGATASGTNRPSTRCVCRSSASASTSASEHLTDSGMAGTLVPACPKFFGELGIEVSTDVANDAFFGRAGRLMASAQLEQELKFEFLVPVHDVEHPTACASLNYHQDHFGDLFDIRTAGGANAHSSCIGFGLERSRLLCSHGMAPMSARGRVR